MRKTTMASLRAARVEKDVENALRAEISSMRPSVLWTSPHGCDGYAVWEATGTVPPTPVRLLTEFKYNVNFRDRVAFIGVLGQVILYLKKFEVAGQVLPNVVLLADKDECAALSTETLRGFLSLNINWAVAPSAGSPELTLALMSGLGTLPYTYDINDKFDFKEVLAKIEHLAAGVAHSVRATPSNIFTIFQAWVDRVFRDKSLSAVDQVDVFLRCLFNPNDIGFLPGKKNVLNVPGYEDGVRVDQGAFATFFEQFQCGYPPSEVEGFYANKDRLMASLARQRQGAFFTPRIWADEAHKEIEKVLGSNWRDECIVWDPAAGTANLTRDYSFQNLIISTAERADVAVIKDQKYNEGASVFQYDFLNPGARSPFFEEEDQDRNVLPSSVKRKLEEAAKSGKRLVFFMNPPFAADGKKLGLQEGASPKKGLADTCVREAMGPMGFAKSQLYTQFLWQAHKLAIEIGFKDVTIATFSGPGWLSASGYARFRSFWQTLFQLDRGILIRASDFAVAGAWGIPFTIWHNAPSVSLAPALELKSLHAFKVRTDGFREFGPALQSATAWGAPPAPGTYPDTPKFGSGLNVWEERHGKPLNSQGADPNSLFCSQNHSNSVQDSAATVSLLPGRSSGSNCADVLPGNSFRRAVALFSAKKLVLQDWINSRDEYEAPDVTLPGYEQWVDDCHVYALFHRYNNCTAMRDVGYKGETFRIKNHFFWKTRAEALTLLDRTGTNDLYRDCKNEPLARTPEPTIVDVMLGLPAPTVEPFRMQGDPYLASVLPNLSLSLEAQNVLRILNDLWEKSLQVREQYANGKPELHLGAWDAGIFQLKHPWRDLFPVEWEGLQGGHKVLAAKLQPGVYDYGFLRK